MAKKRQHSNAPMRRGSRDQGYALERLGHAVEYLVDSRMFLHEDADGDREAVQILMRCSRAVFSECPEVISLRRRLRIWLKQRRTPAAMEMTGEISRAA